MFRVDTASRLSIGTGFITDTPLIFVLASTLFFFFFYVASFVSFCCRLEFLVRPISTALFSMLLYSPPPAAAVAMEEADFSCY